ncbi:D-alanyl-D-alanine carboxypeptidase family protein [Mesobacillus maritimus]|uniref:M15 family metallopeptidase n=1 Tax=Mesobacillus maritimus TaxID=1643336 RepID=UPI0038510C58
MKKFWLLCLVVFFLSGCTSMELLMDKLPFINSTDYTGEGSSSKSTQEGSAFKELNSTSEQASEDEGMLLEGVIFNEIQTVNGEEVIQNASNLFALVNKNFGLPAEYFPDDLVRPNVSFSFGNEDVEKSKLRKEAAKALERMFADAEQSGVMLYAVSGYRSYDRQETLFTAEVQNIGGKMAVEAVATPGNSEHQTGLAMDISSRSVGLSLTEQFGVTPEGKWLEKNAHRFGFILRYPKGKEHLTGYMYEPWHYRYVGHEVAKEIYRNDWTLEEYFEKAKKMKDSV